MRGVMERLALGDTLVGDGAWGTLLFARGLKPGEPPEIYNLTRPEVLEEITGLYVDAGADIITTNTFGGSFLRLKAGGLEDRMAEINRNAVAAARRAAGNRALISGSVGPTGTLLEPYGGMDTGEAYSSFERQIRELAGAGVDLFCVETMTDLREAVLAVEACRNAAPEVPVMATMTFDATPRGFFTVMGVTVAQAAKGLARAGAEIVGSNCGNGIETMMGIAGEFKLHTGLPVAIQSNAGLPVNRGGEVVYPETPDYLFKRAPELLALGVRILGGCCGTTPDHIRALRRAVDDSASRRRSGPSSASRFNEEGTR